MYSIVTANQKGGVGKTTTCEAVGIGLTLAGCKVLFVDADPQGNMTRTLQARPGLTLYDVLHDKRTAAAALQELPQGAIIPSDARLVSESTLSGKGREYALRDALAPVASKFDYCLIDTGPALNILTISALTAANGILIPTKADRYSVDGLRSFYSTVQSVRSNSNRELQILGVIITQFDARANLPRAVVEALQLQAEKLGTKVYMPPIRRTVAAEAWQYTGDFYGTDSTAGRDYLEIIKQIQNDTKDRRAK